MKHFTTNIRCTFQLLHKIRNTYFDIHCFFRFIIQDDINSHTVQTFFISSNRQLRPLLLLDGCCCRILYILSIHIDQFHTNRQLRTRGICLKIHRAIFPFFIDQRQSHLIRHKRQGIIFISCHKIIRKIDRYPAVFHRSRNFYRSCHILDNRKILFSEKIRRIKSCGCFGSFTYFYTVSTRFQFNLCRHFIKSGVFCHDSRILRDHYFITIRIIKTGKLKDIRCSR